LRDDTRREIYEEYATRIFMINYEKNISVFSYIQENIYSSEYSAINEVYKNYLESIKNLTQNIYFNIEYCGTTEELMEERGYKTQFDCFFNYKNFINCGYLNNFPWDGFSYFLDNDESYKPAIFQIKTEQDKIGTGKLLNILKSFNPNTVFKGKVLLKRWKHMLNNNNIFEHGSFRVIVSGSGFTQEVYKQVTYFNNKENNLHPILLMHFPKESKNQIITPMPYEKNRDVKLVKFNVKKFDLYYYEMKRKRGENVNNNFEGLQPERKKK